MKTIQPQLPLPRFGNLLNSKGFLPILAFSILFCLHANGQNVAQRLDSLFSNLREEQKINGNVLVTEHGKVVYEKSFGFAQTGNKILNQTDTRFQLASIGKTFTAVAILQLYEKGKLKLDDPVIRYLKDFPFTNATIRQLLSHTAGLPDLHIFEPYAAQDSSRIVTNADVIPALKKSGRLPFGPGERWSYSNAGYCVLALLVEKISGMSFHSYLARNVWGKASMKNTYPYSQAVRTKDTLRAENYQMLFFSSELQLVDTMRRYRPVLINFGGLQGLGFIAGTTRDLATFDQALYDGRLLKAQTLSEAFTPARLKNGQIAQVEPGVSYGLGWFIGQDTTAGKLVWHSGFIPGGSTLFLRNLTRKQAIVILNNAEVEGVQEAGNNAARILADLPVVPGKKSLAKTYVKNLFTEGPDYAAASFLAMKADTAHYRYSPGEMDFAARQFLTTGHASQALETLKVLTFNEPQAWQPYNSYAEVLQQSGKKREAIIMYQRSLSLNPGNERAKEALRGLGSLH